MGRLLISAAHKSSGKTTVTTGLARALSNQGLSVRAFKKGPDYIDPMWLEMATGCACLNLDFNTQNNKEILSCFSRHATDADISIIEGNKGLHDGVDLEGGNSNAALAKFLKAPVVLVIDTRGITRGVAPLISGYKSFDPDVEIAGVIFNQVGGPRHEGKLRAVMERYSDIPVLGAVHRDPSLVLKERHLGLVPSNEIPEAHAYVEKLAESISRQVDLKKIIEIAGKAADFHSPAPQPVKERTQSVKIGIARDSAFGFYYPCDLQALELAGAQLVPINLLSDTSFPQVDGLFIGGGFPETHMEALEKNVAIRQQIRDRIEDGLPAYAECGGLMYLAKTLTWEGETREMVGIIPGDIIMHKTPQGRGYVKLRETGQGLWPDTQAKTEEMIIPAHEFHYSSLENLDDGCRYAYTVIRGHGIDGKNDGLIYKNLLASYTHLRDVEAHHWAERFVAFINLCKEKDS